MTTRRQVINALGAYALVAPFDSFAQQQGHVWRIGIHASASPNSSGYLLKEFRTTLTSLGYVEGRNIVMDVRWAENRLERLPALAAELVSLNPAVIVTAGSAGVAACQKATSTVPIVFASAGDPIGQGFITSYRRPGGNITGVAFNEEINKKQYEIVKEVLPAAARIATLVNVKNPAQKHHLDDVPQVAKALSFESILVHATKEEELESAFQHAVKAKANALVIASLSPFGGLRARIVELQYKYRLPSFTGSAMWVPAGGLASYYFPSTENWRRAAVLVDKILKGGNPAEIPVEIPTKYEVAINLKTATALGITIPQSMLVRADRIIE
jgi:putative ABC transport system substrate-binding protein